MVLETSLSSWLVAGLVHGINRRPLKKLSPDENALLHLLDGWRREAMPARRGVTPMVVACEAGRDGY